MTRLGFGRCRLADWLAEPENLAILYYNQAVYIINQMDYDADLNKLNAAQDTSIHLAMQSLPFMQKTYQLDPKKKDAVKGLEGIYYLLHDTQVRRIRSRN